MITAGVQGPGSPMGSGGYSYRGGYHEGWAWDREGNALGQGITPGQLLTLVTRGRGLVRLVSGRGGAFATLGGLVTAHDILMGIQARIARLDPWDPHDGFDLPRVREHHDPNYDPNLLGGSIGPKDYLNAYDVPLDLWMSSLSSASSYQQHGGSGGTSSKRKRRKFTRPR